MTEEVKTTETTTAVAGQQSIIDQITESVKDTLKDTATATVQDAIQNLKDKFAAEGVEFTDQIQNIAKDVVTELLKNTGESAAQKVEGLLAEKKDQWAALAVEDPDEARRKLRTFWMGISGVCFAVGAVVGYFADYFIK